MGYYMKTNIVGKFRDDVTHEQFWKVISPVIDGYEIEGNYDESTKCVNLTAYGQASGCYYDELSELAKELGKLSAEVGWISLSNYDDPNLEDAISDFYFGPSEEAIQKYKSVSAVSHALSMIRGHVPAETFEAVRGLLAQAIPDIAGDAQPE